MWATDIISTSTTHSWTQIKGYKITKLRNLDYKEKYGVLERQ